MSKYFSLILLFVFCSLKNYASSDYILQANNGMYYILHEVEANESLQSISNKYYVFIATLLNFNQLDESSKIQLKQKIKIPLTETNFYKSVYISKQKGYKPVYYAIHFGENAHDLSKLFNVDESILKQWNANQLFENGEKVIVGWIKILDATSTLMNTVVQNKTQNKTVSKSKLLPSNNTKRTIKEKQTKIVKATPIKEKKEITNKEKVGLGAKVEKLWHSIFHPTNYTGEDKKYAKAKNENNTNNKTAEEKQVEIKRPIVKKVQTPVDNNATIKKKETKSYTGTDKKYGRKSKAKPSQTKQTTIENDKTKVQVVAKETKPLQAVQKTAKNEKPVEAKPKKEIKKKENNTLVKQEKLKAEAQLKQGAKEAAEAIAKEEKRNEEENNEETVVKNELIPLKFNATSNGKSSFFFSGPIGGKFYAVTNIAQVGDIIKVQNTANGKYIMAEVISKMPSADSNDGLLLKVSDNTKLPLGVSKKTFTCKIHYIK
ncbi:MAG: LysM domain-containing protein [Chitinophagaceae bacterium]